MTEFKIGDKVELLEDFNEYKKGTVGLVASVSKYSVLVDLNNENCILGYFSKFKKLDTPQTNKMKGRENMIGEKEINKLKVIACKMKSIAFFNTDDITLVNTFIDYFQKSNTDKIFEMLGVKVNEEFTVLDYYNNPLTFKRKIGNNLIVYVYNNGWAEDDIPTLNYLLNGNWKITKLPQQLLTDEEKQFLNNFEITTLIKLTNNFLRINKTILYDLTILKHKFSGLTTGVEYTPQELGLCSK